MKLLLGVALVTLLLPAEFANAPALNSFRYDRLLSYPARSTQNPSANACAILDANVFAHAAAGLADLRVFDPAGKVEIPFVVTLSSTSDGSDRARIVHDLAKAGPGGGTELDVDLAMPNRPYSEIDLTLNASDYVAAAHVTGLRSLTDTHPVFLGDFTLFDLTSRHLGSDTQLAMAESTFPYLRLRLNVAPSPGNAALLLTPSSLASVQVPPARQAQTLYTGVAQSFAITQVGSQTVASFDVPARVPVERVSFELDPGESSNFSRNVAISAESGPTAPTETITGEIARVHLQIGGREIASESLTIPAIVGSNAQSSARIKVAIDNGQQPPLKLRTVRLEMRQRQLCFAADGTMATLAYGSSSAKTPAYDLRFDASAVVRRATLLHEHTNAMFLAPKRPQSGFKRYSALVWLGVLAAVGVVAVFLYGALQRRQRDSLRG